MVHPRGGNMMGPLNKSWDLRRAPAHGQGYHLHRCLHSNYLTAVLGEAHIEAMT